LSTGYIKELHAALLRNQETVVVFDQFGQAFETPLERGLYKRVPNNPNRANGTSHEYCPPEHVASEMDRLVQLHRQHHELEIRPHVEAAWLHHAFTQIHPFQDGNGRVARALASLVFIKRDFFPLVVNRDDREKYITALEVADRGDLSHLVRLFAQIQKRALTKAISKAVDIKQVTSVEEALAATRDMLVNLGRIIPAEYLKAKETAGVLVNDTLGKLSAVTSTLAQDISRANSEFVFQTMISRPAPANELRAIAEKLQYDPNTNDYYQSVVANFTSSGVVSRIVVSFHSVGAAFRGLVVAVGYFQIGDRPPILVSDDIFRINYQEPPGDTRKRYAAWLDECLIRGLAEWRRTLV
jgi:fido (protein-threonine AMPylation protein)